MIVKAERICDALDRHLFGTQHQFGTLYLTLCDVLHRGAASLFLEDPDEMISRYKCHIGKIVDIETLVQMATNVQ